MPTPTSKRRRPKEERASARRKSSHPVAGKEINYVLQLTGEDTLLLERYQDILAQGAAGFAEKTYNYMFDNPDIADVLYAYERQGGNIGDLVRGQLEHQLGLLNGDIDEKATAESERVGRTHHRWGVKPVWSIGAYRLFVDHLKQLIAHEPAIDAGDRDALECALLKVVFRDMAITCEGYWRAAVEQLTSQRDELGHEQDLAGELLSNIPQLLWTVDIESNRITYASPGTQAFCSDEMEAPIPCFFRIPGSERERVLTAWQQVIDGNSVQLEIPVNNEQESNRWYRMAFYPTANRRGRVLRVHCLMEDVTDLRNDRERLEQLSTQDEVTGLANRTLWYDRLASALAVARRNPGASLAVMVLDINQFKMYNDTLGHEAGDELLRKIAERVQKLLRDTDTLARLGGDEFGIVLPMVQDAEKAAERVAREVMSALSAPFSFKGRELCLSSSIGIAVYPQHGEDPHSLASHADSAMYRAKWNSAPFLFFETEEDASATEHLQFSGQLHGALEREEFELHYQPKIDLASGRICGAEALLRWQHPQQGLVLPKRFISVAEQLGMISPITDWVLDTALAHSKQWQVGGEPVAISINVSARSFHSPGLIAGIRQALLKAGVDGSQLEVEITEDTLMADLDHGAGILEELSKLGVSIAIDDFGTGYSSLSYLKRLPINTLKIDQSFLQDMANDPRDVAIVRSIIELGHNLNCKVVAEGVEAQGVREQLKGLGCDLVQGFYISKPLPDAGFREWLSHSTH
ncbi:diguanylate cyclase (GGDEF)-like protein [Thiogranum longum]|uniref:Diguanylate cyclase DosC n=1 Tax=Thiogranum longum TaxID=1537524 RepID=A0A4R1HF56_9GAMM|nr:EAL domain-containing protein [Thiogranum longum]TCK18840.1 diguanylate cyclase (GGDEF)-like protein [Thiogranum longum]